MSQTLQFIFQIILILNSLLRLVIILSRASVMGTNVEPTISSELSVFLGYAVYDLPLTSVYVLKYLHLAI